MASMIAVDEEALLTATRNAAGKFWWPDSEHTSDTASMHRRMETQRNVHCTGIVTSFCSGVRCSCRAALCTQCLLSASSIFALNPATPTICLYDNNQQQ